MVKALTHICCGPCCTFLLKELKEKGITPRGFFYNPNIHPFTEYQRRREALEKFSDLAGIDVIYHPTYDIENFFRQIHLKEDRPGRCEACYYLRLKKTAQAAKAEGLELFTTTLLISPHQQHDRIKEIASQCGREEGVEFYYQDFRKGFQESIKLSKDAGLYRQDYCGCIFSEREKYQDSL